MKRLAVLVLAVLAFGLTGCASNPIMEIPATMFDPDAAKDTVIGISNSDVAKSVALYAMHSSLGNALVEANKDAGMHIGFGKDENGDQVITSASYKPPQKFDWKIPDKVHDHAVWETLNTFIRVVTPYGAGAFVAHSVLGFADTAVQNAGHNVEAEQYFSQDSEVNVSGGGGGPVTVDQNMNDVQNRSDLGGIPLRKSSTETATFDDGIPDICGGQGYQDNGIWYREPGCSCQSYAAGECS